MLRRALTIWLLASACSKSPPPPAVPPPDDAAPVSDAAPVVLAERPLGLPDHAAFGWRERAGQAAFSGARAAEQQRDWPAVVRACTAALAADPAHLEAAWLLASALGHQGKHAELLAPLQLAVSGDPVSWAQASLELPALASFRATATGAAWIARVAELHSSVATALSRGVLVLAGGDLFAVDATSGRWLRVTRTGGGVIAVLPADEQLAYIARVIPRYGKPTTARELAIGTIDRATGAVTRPVLLGTKQGITVAHAADGFVIGSKGTWRRLVGKKLVPSKTARPPGPYLEVRSRSGALTVLPVPGVVADWDDKGLASALRLDANKRIVSVPSPGLVDGNTLRWSPQKTQLAFVAQLAETCAPGTISAAAVVADVATGRTQELVRASKGIAIQWISERELAIAADDGVAIYDLAGGPPRPLPGADKLGTPKKRARCTDEAEHAPDPTGGDEGPDALVVEPLPDVRDSTPENR